MSLHSVATLEFWFAILLGLSHFGTRTDARAVNVSNTWTMPQEGLNVFYRFFRDRISWFEADAVCQFHHANLVTVDNSFQFDATRDLLRELDVNDIVWIGLMRPQSSERFMWSNSRPLVTDTGYWAESLPLMDAPLCAVIDPIRDYRWHALRCGGPETASFLCEMPVPTWADACILKDMPNLTMQYMADTASIELIRNCAEEGLLKQSCKGKLDRDRALRELICPRERLEAQRINDITNSHFKSLQIINSIRTDNNEKNDIELMPLGETSYGSSSSSDASEQIPTEKNTVQRLIEQFNVDELMQADEGTVPMANYHIPGEIPKPVKKAAKKVIVTNSDDYHKKYRGQKYDESIQLPPPTPKPKKQHQTLALEDMMMGDQPQQSGEPEMIEHIGIEEDEVSNELTESLPHKKKVLPQDLKTMAPITEKSSEVPVSEERQAQRLKEEMERRLVPETNVEISSTASSSFAVPTTTTTATTNTSAAATTSAASSSVVVSLLSTSTTANKPSENKAPITTEQPFPDPNSDVSPITIKSLEPVPSNIVHIATANTTHPTDLDAHVYITSSLAPHTSIKTHEIDVHASATETPATISHPMHPQQQHGVITSENSQHSHVKESADNSHFIPPMLLVKSHYVPPLKHTEHPGAEHYGTGSHERGAPAHPGHGDFRGKLSDEISRHTVTINQVPAVTTTNHMATVKADVTDADALTTITVTTTMAALKSALTTALEGTSAHGNDPAKEATDKSAVIEEEQKQEQKQKNPIAKLIDSNTATTNQQQQQSGKQSGTKAHSLAASEAQDLTKEIKNVEDIIATTTTITAARTTTTPFAASASVANKHHSELIPTTTTAATKTTTSRSTLKSATSATTMKSSKVSMTHEIEKPVKRESETKPVEELTKVMSAKESNKAAEMPVTTTTIATTKTDNLQAVKATDSTHKLLVEDATTQSPPAAAATVESAPENAAPIIGASSTPTLVTIKPTIVATAAVTSAVTTTTSTHTKATTTVCNSDTDVESASIEESSAATESAEDKKKNVRIPRTCQPRIEKNLSSNKHTKQHITTAEPPTPTRNFLKEETEMPPYKPNRHRVLTQPENVSYFKKILG